MSEHDMTNETISFGFEGSTENCMTMIEGMSLQIPKNLKDLKEEMMKLKRENDFLKKELFKSKQNQSETISLSPNGQIKKETSKVTIEDAQDLSNTWQDIIEELASKKKDFSKERFMQELATNYLDALMRQLTISETILSSYLSSIESKIWYEDSVLEEEGQKLTRAKQLLEFMKVYVMEKDKEKEVLTLTAKNKNESLYSPVQDEPCNLCKHITSLTGTNQGKSLIHAKSQEKRSGPYTESCPWIAKLPIVNKNSFLDAYEGFCKLCFSSHTMIKEPCRFTETYPGLRCRSKDCSSRFYLCTEHHEANKTKLKKLKDKCEAADIEVNIDLNN